MIESFKDLLEMAAKAAGFGAPGTGNVCWTESEYPQGSGKKGALWNYVGHGSAAEIWNPLTDDGDALRLAEKLRINIIFDGSRYYVGRERHVFDICCLGGIDALRWSIVRAAAEIGKALP